MRQNTATGLEIFCSCSIQNDGSNALKPLAVFHVGLLTRARTKSVRGPRVSDATHGLNLWSKVLGIKGASVKLLVQPAEHANLGSAECLQPTIEQKVHPHSSGWDLGGFLHH